MSKNTYMLRLFGYIVGMSMNLITFPLLLGKSNFSTYIPADNFSLQRFGSTKEIWDAGPTRGTEPIKGVTITLNA